MFIFTVIAKCTLPKIWTFFSQIYRNQSTSKNLDVFSELSRNTTVCRARYIKNNQHLTWVWVWRGGLLEAVLPFCCYLFQIHESFRLGCSQHSGELFTPVEVGGSERSLTPNITSELQPCPGGERSEQRGDSQTDLCTGVAFFSCTCNFWLLDKVWAAAVETLENLRNVWLLSSRTEAAKSRGHTEKYYSFSNQAQHWTVLSGLAGQIYQPPITEFQNISKSSGP